MVQPKSQPLTTPATLPAPAPLTFRQRTQSARLRAYAALALGIICIGFSAIFTKWANPSDASVHITDAVSTFYRVLIATIALSIPYGIYLARSRKRVSSFESLVSEEIESDITSNQKLETRNSKPGSLTSKLIWGTILAGLFFALDLGVWNTALLFTSAATSTQNTVTCVNRAGLTVIDTVLTQLAAAEACLTPDEKELGVALVDIGGGTTDLAIFEKGSLWHTAVLQVGGEHFTNDVAVALRTPVNEAEKIKKKHGCALTSMVPEEDSIEVPSVGGRKPRIMARQVLGDVIQARAEEICQMILTEIRRAGFDRSLNSGVVLTGGGAILEGMPEIAETIFDMPVRRGTPSGIGGLVDVVASPVYSTAVGLVLCGHRNRMGRGLVTVRPAATGTWGRVTTRLMSWLGDFF